MKILMNVLIFVLASFSFAACEKANYQVSPDSIDKPAENYSGTFEATYKNYKNFSTSVTITGSININFNSGSYSYNGNIISSDSQLNGPVHDNGNYTLMADSIKMYDNSTKLMNPAWQPSLYLSGIYSYTDTGSQLIIQGEGQYGSIRIVLNAQ